MPEDFRRNAVMFWNFDPQIFLVLAKNFYNPGPGELFVTRLPGSGGASPGGENWGGDMASAHEESRERD